MSNSIANRRALFGAALTVGSLGLLHAAPAEAAEHNGLVTRRSAHSVAETIDRFRKAVTDAGWVVFTEIDHAAAAAAVGMKLAPRTVVLFGNPRNGTPAMAAHPTLALDLPMRVLVWEDSKGTVFFTRSTGSDVARRVFARHGVKVDAAGRKGMEAFFEKMTKAAIT